MLPAHCLSALTKKYFDIRVILPKYACMKQEWKDKNGVCDPFLYGSGI